MLSNTCPAPRAATAPKRSALVKKYPNEVVMTSLSSGLAEIQIKAPALGILERARGVQGEGRQFSTLWKLRTRIIPRPLFFSCAQLSYVKKDINWGGTCRPTNPSHSGIFHFVIPNLMIGSRERRLAALSGCEMWAALVCDARGFRSAVAVLPSQVSEAIPIGHGRALCECFSALLFRAN